MEDRFRADGNQSTHLSFGELSPMGGLLWAVGPGVNLYTNISSMFETPTFTELARVSTGGFANVKAQRALNYELGVKGAPNPRFSYEPAVFHIAVQDEIINVANRGGRTFSPAFRRPSAVAPRLARATRCPACPGIIFTPT